MPRLHQPLPVSLLVLVLCSGCMTFRTSPAKLERFFEMRSVDGAIGSYTAAGRKMYFAEAGPTEKPLVVFVHGSPGSLSAFTGYLVDSTLLACAHLITVDRPGFGYSGFGVAETSVGKQAGILKTLVASKKTFEGKKIILAGHSMGGPVVAKMAMDYPDLIDGIVIIAGSIDPDLEPNEAWFRGPLATPFLKWILPRSLRASNDELYKLKPELQLMADSWHLIKCPVAVVHGKKDGLVPFGNVAFAEKKLPHTPVEYFIQEDGSHFIPWQNRELVKDAILFMLQKTTANQEVAITP